MSAVNLAEVQTILLREGGDPDESWALAVDPIPEVEPFVDDARSDRRHARAKDKPPRPFLGDRACLALAIALGAPVLATDRLWKKLMLVIPIHLLR